MNYPVSFGGVAVFKEIQQDLILLKRGLIFTGTLFVITQFICLYVKMHKRKKDSLGTSRFANKNDIIEYLYNEDGD